MLFGGVKLDIPNLRFLGNQYACLSYVARHENPERNPKTVENALVKGGQLIGTLRRELKAALDLLARKFTEVLVDDVAYVFQVDREGDDLHRPRALALIKAAAGELGHVKLDRFIQPINRVVHARNFRNQRTICGRQSFHDLAKHGLDDIAHVQGRPRRTLSNEQ